MSEILAWSGEVAPGIVRQIFRVYAAKRFANKLGQVIRSDTFGSGHRSELLTMSHSGLNYREC